MTNTTRAYFYICYRKDNKEYMEKIVYTKNREYAQTIADEMNTEINKKDYYYVA